MLFCLDDCHRDYTFQAQNINWGPLSKMPVIGGSQWGRHQNKRNSMILNIREDNGWYSNNLVEKLGFKPWMR